MARLSTRVGSCASTSTAPTGAVQIAQLPGYSPQLNPVDYLLAWLKRHALANFCPRSLTELKITARNKLRSGQHRRSIITACRKQAELW